MTNEDLLSQLYEKRAELMKQLEALENAIVGFGGDPATGKEKKPRRGRTPGSTSTASSGTSTGGKVGRPSKANKPIKVPSEYSESLTWKGKIIYVLDEKGAMITNDIAAEIVDKEPKLDLEKTTAAIRIAASDLKKRNQIGYQQVGNKYKYFLFDK
ncbi:hypothetical protein AB9P05_07225 [Roseivirga sp. BDSF3-8]|uniref:hypothetical protein n=1 Tax=Roseivirga sp. BDSF3-8 TaxID=3241598 RepID=UPI003531EB5F